VSDILGITGPIYLAIALGYVCTRLGWFSKADMRVLGQFVVKVALPALLFNAVASRNLTDILNPTYLLAYTLGSLLVIALGLWWGKRQQLPFIDNVMAVMGMSCSNSGYMGYPILLLTLAPVAAVSLALNMMVENLVVIPLLLVLAERGLGHGGHGREVLVRTVRQLATNPLIVALAAGLLVALLRWELPAPLLRSINLFAAASAGLSLAAARHGPTHRTDCGGQAAGVPGRGGPGHPGAAAAGAATPGAVPATGGRDDGSHADDGHLPDPGAVLRPAGAGRRRAAGDHRGVVFHFERAAVADPLTGMAHTTR